MNPPPLPEVSRDRASFQSPTRASLARSHPEILARAMNRSPARRPNKDPQNGSQSQEARTFGLRDRKALRPSLTSIGSPMDRGSLSGGPLLSPARRSTAFAAPPRRVSRKILPTDLNFGSPVTRKDTAEQAQANTPEDQLASELDSATVDAGDFEPPSLHETLEEPELPPTPTQLGLEKPPGRPKGLLSSSPSSRRGKRTRRRANELGPSPLKLRNVESEDVERGTQELLPESVVKKQKVKNELSTELQRLKDDIAELEGYTDKMKSAEPSGDDFDKLLSLLTSDDPSQNTVSRPSNPPISTLLSSLLPFSTKAPPITHPEPFPTNPFALAESAQTKPYLTVFAPLALTTHSNELSTSKSESLLETHKLTLSAPPPFPSNLYNVSIVYETNPETQSIISLYVPAEDSKSNIPETLHQWITSRLANSLTKLDVSGLCWGINRYWEAAISRAQIWTEIESRHSQLTSLSAPPNKTSISNLRRLTPHLSRSTMLFGKKNLNLKLLLSCTISIDEWTGEPQLTAEINISRGSKDRKIELDARKLFHGLIGQYEADGGKAGADGILRGVEGVLGALFGDV